MGLLFNVSLAVFAALGSFLFGYDSGIMSDTIASPNSLMFFKTSQKSPIVGAINSTFSGGAVFGSLIFTMDSLGRRKTVLIGGVINLVGAALQAGARNLAMILVGRIFAGWAVGLLSMSVPISVRMRSSFQKRCLIVGITQQMIGVGFIFSTWIGYGSAHVPASSGFSWRFPLAFQLVPCILIITGILFFPESPRYLVETDRADEALVVLRRLHYNGSNEDDIQAQFHEIKTTIEAEKAVTAPGSLVMFKVKSWRIRLTHATLMQVPTQMTGINVIGYYQTILYNNLGITGHRNLLVAGIYNVVGPLTNLIFITFVLDRVGRRKPLLFGTIGITIALICEAVIGSQVVGATGTRRDNLSGAGVFFLFCVSVIFSMSFGPTSWVYASEIMPLSIRGRGSAFATGIGNWLVSTLWSQVSPIALGKITYTFYFIFVAFNLFVTFPTIFFVFKETKQLTLEEIDLLFGERALGTLPNNIDEKQASETIEQVQDA